jgi:CheY-like chemotaxis protein
VHAISSLQLNLIFDERTQGRAGRVRRRDVLRPPGRDPCRVLADVIPDGEGDGANAGAAVLVINRPGGALDFGPAAARTQGDDMKRLEGQRILVADDESGVRELIAMGLAYHGAEVTTAENGAEALRAFRCWKFDCIITDYSMLGMKGDALALTIKRDQPAQRVVMLSGFAAAVLQQGRLPDFLDALLNKPCDLRDLVEAVAPRTDAAEEKSLEADGGDAASIAA